MLRFFGGWQQVRILCVPSDKKYQVISNVSIELCLDKIISPYSIKLRKLFGWEDTRYLPHFEQILCKDTLLFLSTNQLGPQGFLRYPEISLGSWPLPANPGEHTRRIYPIFHPFAELSDTLEYLRTLRIFSGQQSTSCLCGSHMKPQTTSDYNGCLKRAHIHTVNLH